MHYQQTAIILPAHQAEPLSDALMEHGALSSAIEDAYAHTAQEETIFCEPGMASQRLWQQSLVLALFNADTAVQNVIEAAANSIGIACPDDYTVEFIPEQDWVQLTQAQFEPIRISDRLWVTPSWHTPPKRDVINLKLDPGLAFGTGSHPTTHLCLQWLDQHLTADSHVLDYGCGSGILAIGALKLGAGSAVGVDIDPQAIRTAEKNAATNHVDAQFFLPDTLPAGQFDVVIANILANPLRLLASMLANRCKVGGRIVLSGILDEQTEELSNIYREWFELDAPETLDGWVRISGYRKA